MDEMNLLRTLDPAKDFAASSPAELREVERRITASSYALSKSQRGRWGRIALLATAASVLAVTALAYSWTRGPAPATFAVTPRVLSVQPVPGSANSTLRKLALRAAQHDEPLDDPLHVISQEWNLNARVMGERVTNFVQPMQRDLRWAEDGTGKLEVTALPATYSRPSGQTAAPSGSVLERTLFTPAHPYKPMYAYHPPTAPDSVIPYLSVGHPIKQYGTAEMFVALADLLNERGLSGAQTSAVLNALANRTDIEVLGSVTDRLGRSGTAFLTNSAYSGLPTSYILVVDSASGHILAQEKWLTQTSGALNVRVPAVISYTVWK